MRSKNVSISGTLVVVYMYINQQIQVQRNSAMSMKSSISNGVKQGGCIFLNLFSVYLNMLIKLNVNSMLIIMTLLLIRKVKYYILIVIRQQF